MIRKYLFLASILITTMFVRSIRSTIKSNTKLFNSSKKMKTKISVKSDISLYSQGQEHTYLDSLKCHTDDAFQYSQNVMTNRGRKSQIGRVYKPLSEETGGSLEKAKIGDYPSIISAGYPNSQFSHEYVLHAAEYGYDKWASSQDCMRNVKYEYSLLDVSDNTDEFVSGCTPFRERAKEIIFLNKCLQDIIVSHTSHQLKRSSLNDILRRMGFVIRNELKEHHTTRRIDGTDGGGGKEADQNLREKIVPPLISSLKKFIAPLIHNSEDLEAVTNDFKVKCIVPIYEDDVSTGRKNLEVIQPELMEALLCLPVISGATGMLGNGLSNHGDNWMNCPSSEEMKSSGLKDVEIKSACDIHPMCGRLATEKLLNFTDKMYDKFVPSLRMIFKNPKLEDCRKATTSNCRYHTACWKAALKHVCKEHWFCCPSQSVHSACVSNVDSELCSSICS